jgi:hypothetical protein
MGGGSSSTPTNKEKREAIHCKRTQKTKGGVRSILFASKHELGPGAMHAILAQAKVDSRDSLDHHQGIINRTRCSPLLIMSVRRAYSDLPITSAR